MRSIRGADGIGSQREAGAGAGTDNRNAKGAKEAQRTQKDIHMEGKDKRRRETFSFVFFASFAKPLRGGFNRSLQQRLG
jgi:hypothetical protein